MSYSKQSLAKRYFFSKATQNAEEYTDFFIRYKPRRVDRMRLARTKHPIVKTLFMAFLIWLPLALTYIHDLYGCIFLFSFLLLTTHLVMSNVWRLAHLLAPTHIELNERGMRFHWLHLFFKWKTPLVAWDRISHVTTITKNVSNNDEITLEFNAITRGISFKKRFSYFVLAPALTWGWLTSDRALIRFGIDAIASSDDRKRLQLALKKFLPSYRIEPKVADDLNMYIKFESYTDLWLDKLQESTTRERDNSLDPGTTLANSGYTVIEHIGSGGQALVYLASMTRAIPETANLEGVRKSETLVDFTDLPIALEQDSDGPPPSVVLKEFVLPIQAGANVRKRVLENIQKEAKLWRKLKHPNIARLIDFFVEDQRAYLVLEHVEGTTLKDVVTTGGAMIEEKVVALAIQMCDILGYLHRRQPPVVHRDFTPDNLIMSADGNVKLIDFNVAQQLEAQTTKTVVGKHSYIPPEQFRGKAVPQSDLYALGATLSFLLTGKDPEPITQAHPKLAEASCSQELDDIVAKATTLGLSGRYQDCQELKTDLVAIMQKLKPAET